ncbi:RNA polymerase rpoB (apicoplast) [Plasmodium falciparum IGH-CR14]|uniref:DNA-directed RNA polymerase subunit beta n=5 Tax=Plasmodium falciparum TaxID=5833 RepID=RPOB_PLAF7|nr:RecName: Full=DNA-directed RNA polymerase subunit beta; AltName: Full=PEP; AltName: Full=Plastid-encoded RNA polymerase subunit beta; Short=RNA polymerase subunit beta [Plasmodium falciparum 3D7]KAF4331507.1 DNA-directed RNA polymerase subunit beta [Plasmodium falciparum NF54]KNZ35488.1 RNA polymerase rpoB [Plasmodium falciparum IGH-CR14]KNZ35529.1 RNA polymerase rpoB [Plasmodium falciparum RAJ116]CAA53232.1 beta subunit RNA polymerase [Plasmodium falciparum]CAA64572.1 rpoB [Plasmodium falc|eukprot:YP_009455733.1 RNA polymerase beta subunit, putative (apicoplast) [Plasmodium falciparum 3D7]
MIYIVNPILVKNNYIISNLYLLLIQEIIYNLRYYILFLNNNINVKFNFIYYKIIILLTNININSIDTIQNINNLLKIILTLKLNFININKIIKFNILIFILPFIYNNIIILNGLYKTCIQLFKKNNKIFIIKFKNNNKNIIYVYIYISLGLRIIFKISKLNIDCYFNNFKFNFLILLLYLNNIYINKNISLFIYNNIINKKILIYNYIKFIYSKYNNINNIISLKLFIIKLNKFNNIYINLLNILFSIKLNFSYYSDFYINNIYNKKFYSIIDNLLIKSKKYLKIFKYQLLNINRNIYNNITLLLNNKKYINIILENININPLVQYSDQVNNLSEINQKFKINMITTGLNSKFILNNDLRELPRNILGYISLINTNEGLTCGLVNYLTTNIFLNLKYLFVIYYKHIFYNRYNFKLLLNIFNKNFYNISFNNIYLKKNINFNKTTILTINKNTFKICNITQNIIYIPFNYLLSFIENLIPFIHYNDSIRNLMSIKMHTQIVPIIYPNLSNIITNYNFILNKYLNHLIISYQEGIVIYVSCIKIIIRDLFNRQIIYYLNNYKKINQNILLIYKPIVWVGEKVNIGQILAINSNLLNSEYSLGNNLLVGYGSYLGYEYEDAIIISRKILYNNLYTSLHLNIYEISLNIINNIPEICSINLSKMYYKNIKHLDKYGIIKEGTYILANNILISKLMFMPFIFNNKSLINIINFLFGSKLRIFKNKPIISTIHDIGRVIKIEILPNHLYNKTEKNNIYLKFRIYIGIQKYLQLGDKICNRHGHKGIISYISEINDIPYLNNKIQPDIFISAISIPSRINIGQIFEGIYGLNSLYLNTRYIISNNLNKNYYNNYNHIFNYYKYNYNNNFNINSKMSYNYNKYYLKNPFTGNMINNSICLNNIYYYKLIHMIKDKFRYRFIGLYSELTQQPIKGNTKQGGQRFGEMEVWALEAFGASYLFKEFFTYKSDDIKSRKILKNYLFNNYKIKNTFISETFKLILKELQSLAINIEAFCIFNDTNNLLENLPINIIY